MPRGPFTSAHFHSGDLFELSDGYPIPVVPRLREKCLATSQGELARLTRSGRVSLDWNTVFARVAIHARKDREIWSKFPVELDEQTILTPHLFDRPRPFAHYRGGKNHCTFVETPTFAVLLTRGPEHYDFAVDELVPALHPRVPLVVLVNADTRRCRLAPLSGGADFDVDHLPLLLDRWLPEGEGANPIFPEDLFEREPGYASFFAGNEPTREEIAAAEAAPIRLWEALFSRGYTRRYELIAGEVPLIGELPTALAANRALLQCLADATLATGCRAVDDAGWIRCGAFRMRQRDRTLEIRVRPSAADRRVAFLPERVPSGSLDLPSLLGVLLSGGDNGKTELMDGWTWATAELDSPAEVARLLPDLVAEIERWTGHAPEVRARDSGLPGQGRSEAWVLRHAHDEPWLDVFVPFGRDDCLPFKVCAGGFSAWCS